MSNMIIIEDKEAIVTLDTILSFSGLKEKQVKDVVRKQFSRLKSNGMSYPFKFDLSSREKKDKTLNYSEIKFDDKSCTLLLTLLPNNEATEQFKETLVNQFFDMRELIANEIRKGNALTVKKKNKLIQELSAMKRTRFKAYDGEHGALLKYITDKELDIDVIDVFVFLEKKGIVKSEIVPRIDRVITKKGKKLHGEQIAKGSPSFNFKELDKLFAEKKFKSYIKAMKD